MSTIPQVEVTQADRDAAASCKWCAGKRWYTSFNGGVEHQRPCDYCNREGVPQERAKVMSKLLPVIQADIDAARAFWRLQAARIMAGDKTLGEEETADNPLVQAFARHRIASTPQAPQEVVERVGLAIVQEIGWGSFSHFDPEDVRRISRAAVTASGLVEAREALEPFARVVTDYEENGVWLDLGDDERLIGRIRRNRDETADPPAVTIGHLRRARTALDKLGRGE